MTLRWTLSAVLFPLFLILNSIPVSAIEITVDPADFNGSWRITGKTLSTTGLAVVDLEDGTYQFGVGGFVNANFGNFTVIVDGTGFVTAQNGVSATGGQNEITFNTTPVAVDPVIFDGSWRISGVQNGAFGPLTLNLVPGVSYLFGVGGFANANFGNFRVSVDGTGFLTVQNEVSATGGQNTITYNDTTIQVDPGEFLGSWQLSGVLSTSGAATIRVVPGVTYLLAVSGTNSIFSVSEPCAVLPPEHVFGNFTIVVLCGPPDTDFDGVPDDTDNCPLIANSEQVDQDLDGIGNLCDPDLDGDEFDNVADNCPEIANADQDDLDGDGIGDACEDDTDGDAVPNSADNCPLVANTGQADNDDDDLGDACDADDDNDGVGDILDNCPVVFNPDQENFDGDAEGDACDGDSDDDGVPNETDLCSASPLDKPVSVEGCTGAQFIALQCAEEDFVQHGQFVSCVAHAANDAVDQELLSPNEKARFVTSAAKKK